MMLCGALGCTGELNAVSQEGQAPSSPSSPGQQEGDLGFLPDGAMAKTGDRGGETDVDPGLEPERAGALPLRALTRVEYERTVNALLEVDASQEASRFPSEITGKSGFATVGQISPLHVERFARAAEAIAERSGPYLEREHPCDQQEERECAVAFIERFGEQAHRRPLESQEREEYLALYDAARQGELELDHREALKLIVEATLQSPFFLYHWQLQRAPEGPDEALGAWQLANRLSYFLWRSMPDAALRRAAQDGELGTREGVERQARRLLADERAHATVADFFVELAHLERLPDLPKHGGLFPDFDEHVRASLLEAARAYIIEAVFGEGGGRYDELLTASWAMVDEHTAALYGVGAPSSGAFERVELNPDQRAGLLTHPALLAVHADATEGNPIFRGLMVREVFLCDEVPPPQGDVPALPTGEGGDTLRERVTHHTSGPQCASCHTFINEPGFALGHYDAIGAYIETERGQAIDPSGELRMMDSEERFAFKGARDLAEILAVRPEVHRCLVERLSAFALARALGSEDVPSLDALAGGFEASSLDVPELLVAIVTSKTFRHASPAPIQEEISP